MQDFHYLKDKKLQTTKVSHINYESYKLFMILRLNKQVDCFQFLKIELKNGKKSLCDF